MKRTEPAELRLEQSSLSLYDQQASRIAVQVQSGPAQTDPWLSSGADIFCGEEARSFRTGSNVDMNGERGKIGALALGTMPGDAWALSLIEAF